MKNICILTVMLMILSNGNAQYYYLDIVGTQQTNKQYEKIKQQSLQKIAANSFEGNNQPSTDFVLDQTIDLEKNQITTRSASVNSAEAYFISYYQNNKLTKTVDSNANAINMVLYTYDDQGRLLKTESANKDFDGTSDLGEVHQWQYNSTGQPVTMLKIKNNRDTVFVSFKTDTNGNVTEENWQKNNRIVETYYYYYNTANRLTDIVRFNRKAQRMLPDFMFEYDDAGLVSQMTQTQGTSANYLIWRYVYDTNGMKQKEYVFNKQKELLGKIEYTYQ